MLAIFTVVIAAMVLWFILPPLLLLGDTAINSIGQVAPDEGRQAIEMGRTLLILLPMIVIGVVAYSIFSYATKREPYEM